MNKRLEKEFGEHIVEKRGWYWALTRFAVDTWVKLKKHKLDRKALEKPY
jgi:hypothetical protein